MQFISKVGVLFVLSLAFMSHQVLAEKKVLDDADFNKIYYGKLLDIKSFGWMCVSFQGEGAKKIGLKTDELTDLLKLKFKNNFANVPYKDQSNTPIHKIAPTVGTLFIRVWIVGDDYPIAYHIKINAGTFEEMDAYENAVLGYGSKRDVPDTVKRIIGELVEKLAIEFFEARGEL